MKLGIINSAFDQAGVDTKTGLEHIARIGFDCVDVFTEAEGLPAEEEQLILDTCAANNLPMVSMPVVAIGLIDFNDPVRAYHVARVKKFVDLTERLGGKNILLVLGEYLWQKEVIPPEAQWQWAVECCREIGDYCASKGLEIALELEPFRLSLLNNVDAMAKFLKDCDHPAVKANIDISHLVLADCGPEEIAKLAGNVAHVHISDCNGQVHGDLPPGRGIVKFGPYLQAIKAIGFDGVVSIELEYSPDPDRIVEWVEEAYTQTAKLMDLAGVRS